MATNLALFADYFQIQVLDDDSESDLSDAWTDPEDASEEDWSRVHRHQGTWWGAPKR